MPTRPSSVGDGGHLTGHQGLHDVVAELAANVPSTAADIGAVDAAGAVTAVGGKLWFGTQAQCDALPVQDPATLYIVT